MELYEAIEKRYSYRSASKEKKVERDVLRKIVEAGLKAPSGKNFQTTEFIIVDDEKILDRLRDVLPGKDTMKTCSALILCVMDKNPEKIYHGHHFQVEDCSAAVENMLLAITAEGLATVWLDGVLRVDGKGEKAAEITGLPEDKIIRIMLPLGYPVEEGPRREKLPFEKRAWFNKYGK